MSSACKRAEVSPSTKGPRIELFGERYNGNTLVVGRGVSDTRKPVWYLPTAPSPCRIQRESISSMKITAGADFLATLNSFRTCSSVLPTVVTHSINTMRTSICVLVCQPTIPLRDEICRGYRQKRRLCRGGYGLCKVRLPCSRRTI